MGTFITIEIDQVRFTGTQATLIPTLCPVDIFSLPGERLVVRPEQEDECMLCELCLRAAPSGAITIRKTYKPEVLISGIALP